LSPFPIKMTLPQSSTIQQQNDQDVLFCNKTLQNFSRRHQALLGTPSSTISEIIDLQADPPAITTPSASTSSCPALNFDQKYRHFVMPPCAGQSLARRTVPILPPCFPAQFGFSFPPPPLPRFLSLQPQLQSSQQVSTATSAPSKLGHGDKDERLAGNWLKIGQRMDLDDEQPMPPECSKKNAEFFQQALNLMCKEKKEDKVHQVQKSSRFTLLIFSYACFSCTQFLLQQFIFYAYSIF